MKTGYWSIRMVPLLGVIKKISLATFSEALTPPILEDTLLDGLSLLFVTSSNWPAKFLLLVAEEDKSDNFISFVLL